MTEKEIQQQIERGKRKAEVSNLQRRYGVSPGDYDLVKAASSHEEIAKFERFCVQRIPKILQKY